MTDNTISWVAVSALFEQLQDVSIEEAEETLSTMSLDSASLELLRNMLLAHHEKNLLDQSVDQVAENLLEGLPSELDAIPDNLEGAEFGAWRVIKEIDRGGMGVVFQAERADGQFDKTVALKVIKPGRYTHVTKERFQQEMRMLAQLEHPNIVALIDGGINDDGIPWFAMEYVEGQPVTTYADQNQLTVDERVALVIDVCKAVEHAHRNLIIHGDLKPSNILVSNRGRVKLLDFGIARTLLGETRPDAMPRFTPRYASPELASGEPMTTSSDVFGLCAILYELISGYSPRDELSTTTRSEYGQYMQAPVPAVFEKYSNSADTQQIAGYRSTTMRGLKRSLKGDLRWILQHGLTVDPARRLSSVSALRADLSHYLAGRAVAAHPASNTYYIRKFVMRYRLPILAGVLIVSAMLMGTFVARQQAKLAKNEAENARWSSEFLLKLFDEADPWRNQQSPLSVNQLTSVAVTDLLKNRQGLSPDVQVVAAAILARVEGRLGHLESSEKLLELQISLLEEQPDSEAELASALTQLGIVEANLSKDELATKAFRRAHTLQPVGDRPGRVAVNSTIEYAYDLAVSEKPEESRELMNQLYLHEGAILKMENAESLMARLYNTESFLSFSEGDLRASREAAMTAVSYAKLAHDDAPVVIGKTLLSLAETFHQQGDSESALPLDQQVVEIFTRYYGHDHPQTLESQGRLAVSLSNLGRTEEAITIYNFVLEGQIASLGTENEYVAATLGNIGAAYLALNQAQQALDKFSESQAVWESITPEKTFSIALNKIGIARSLQALQRLNDANVEFLDGLKILEGAVGTSHVIYSRAEIYYAPLLLELELLGEAQRRVPSAYDNILEIYGVESKHTALAGLRWAELLIMQGKPDQALPLLKQAVEVFDTDANRGRNLQELKRARTLIDDLG